MSSCTAIPAECDAVRAETDNECGCGEVEVNDHTAHVDKHRRQPTWHDNNDTSRTNNKHDALTPTVASDAKASMTINCHDDTLTPNVSPTILLSERGEGPPNTGL